MNTRLLSATVMALALAAAGTSFAAAPGTPAAAAAPAAAQGTKTVQAMFNFADQNEDGKLTRAEARGHLPATYAAFDRIDTAQRGWINLAQFTEFTNQRVGKQADAVLKIGDWRQ